LFDSCLGHTRARRRLLPSAIPSVFFWTKPASTSTLSRRSRAARRLSLDQSTANCDNASTSSSVDVAPLVEQEVEHEETVSAASCKSKQLDIAIQTDTVTSACSYSQTEDRLSAVPIPTVPFLSFENLQHDQDMLHYYTGLETVKKIMTVFYTLGPAVYHLNYFHTQTVTGITPLNQFILTLAKLRQDLDYMPLSRLCGISEFTARNIFITWINFCSRQWSEINIWPEKDLVQFYSPTDFKVKFPTTRVIVDGTEIPVQKPANPIAQRCTFSTYKNRNTVKVLVGSTPGGLISYLSPSIWWIDFRQTDS